MISAAEVARRMGEAGRGRRRCCFNLFVNLFSFFGLLRYPGTVVPSATVTEISNVRVYSFLSLGPLVGLFMRLAAKRPRLAENDPSFTNEYAGHRLEAPAGGGRYAAVDRRRVAVGEAGEADGDAEAADGTKGLTPRALFNQYIRARRPVVLRGAAGSGVDPEWRGSRLWTDEHFKAVAGDNTIRAERRRRDDDGSPFGKGAYERMTFGEFVDLLGQGDTRHYMTTEDPVEDASGQLNVMANPCTSLFRHGDFPMRPKIAGNLIPATINMWFGNSAQGSSSGLHHDFHDNLYVLLRGRKRFRLYSPADAHCMYTAGAVETVHKNGLIRYKGGPETFADGSTPGMRALAAANARREAAEQALEAAERDAAAGVSGAQERLQRAETEMDEALDAVMDVEMGEGGGSFDFDDDEGEEEEEEEAIAATGVGVKSTLPEKDDSEASSSTPADEDDGGADADTPANFSHVDPGALTPLSQGMLEARWPKMTDATSAVVELEADDVLYLPAGWFHEVTSVSEVAEAAAGGQSCVANARSHLAFNYWFPPPDGNEFERPYSSDFWSRDWERKEGAFVSTC